MNKRWSIFLAGLECRLPYAVRFKQRSQDSFKLIMPLTIFQIRTMNNKQKLKNKELNHSVKNLLELRTGKLKI